MSELRLLGRLLHDALSHAEGVARRAQEATEGTDATMIFSRAADALGEFAKDHPAMRELAVAIMKEGREEQAKRGTGGPGGPA